MRSTMIRTAGLTCRIRIANAIRLIPPPRFPNPSFEEQNCCPHEPSAFGCLTDWSQPSEPTVDYNHSCHWLEWTEYPIPLPLPDGEGCVGFRDGFFDLRNENPQWKEYASTCLDFPLQPDVMYTIELSIGFSHEENSPPMQLAVFGIHDCGEMNFGGGNVRFGCPTNDPRWRFLGGVDVDGIDEWKRIQIELKPREVINAIAIGPGCKEYPGLINTYYFLDHIVMIEQSDFEAGISLTGHPCHPDTKLEVQERAGYSYQWYKEGIALVGEHTRTLSQSYGDGVYQVRMESPDRNCKQTDEFVLETPESYTELESAICEGEVYLLGNKEFAKSGVYLDTLQSTEGCDSVILLDLKVKTDLGDTVEAKIFPSESYQVGSNRFSSPGTYEVSLLSASGCDSTVFLRLSYYEIFSPTAFSPNGDGINEHFSLSGGKEVLSISRLKIFNRWGKLMYEKGGISPGDMTLGWDGMAKGTPAPEGVYVFVAHVQFDDGKERTTSGSFTLLR